MAECLINGNSVEKGITSFVDKELMSSGMFTKEGDSYMVKPTQTFDAEQFVGGINRKFSENVIKQISRTRYEIAVPETVVLQYLKSIPEGQEIATTTAMYTDFEITPQSWNKEETFSALNYPEITEFTYYQLIAFLTSVNPNFRVEEVDNLSTAGVTSLKDFLIKVKTLSKFSALPEEVAHVFIELIPDDNPLKVEMLANITSYKIYGETLAKYKDVYTLPDGRPDYDKIKREAAAKLVGVYVTAISTDNFSQVEELTKPQGGFIKRWLHKLIKWLGINMLNHTQSYADIAGIILSGETDMSMKTEKDIADMNYTDSYFYRLSEEELYENTTEIYNNRPPQLLETISKFSKEFGRRFNDILKDDRFSALNEELKKSGNVIGKINRLSEIKLLLNEANIDLRAALDTDTFITGIKQFLEAVDRLDILTKAILNVIKNKEKSKTFDEAVSSMAELEAYFGLYETFQNIISGELASTLIQSGVGSDVVESVQRTHTAFKNVNDHLLERHKNDLFIFYKSMLSESNQVAADILNADIEREKAKGTPNKEIIAMFEKRIKSLIVTDDAIISMLSGKGKDIDNFSSLNHLVNASRINGDPYLSTVAKYIENKVSVAQNRSQVVVRNLLAQIDPIQKALNEPAHVTGKYISFPDKYFDRDTNEEREVLSYLNPHKNIQPALDALRRKVSDTAMKRFATDKNSADFQKADDDYKKARRDYQNFLEKFMHRPFLKEYYNFRNEFEDNSLFITAMARWKEFSDIIDYDEDLLRFEPENEDVFVQLSRNKRDRANLLSEFDTKGDPKPESELELVRILKRYFDESNKFMEDDEVQTELSYQVERNRYEQKVEFAIAQTDRKNFKRIEDVEKSIQEYLKDPRIRIVNLYNEVKDPTDPIDYPFIKDILMEKWYSKNITIRRNEKFYEDEKKLRDQLDELQKKGELSEAETNIKLAYDELRKILFGSRDSVGQINPDSLSEEERQMVIDLEDFIAEQKLEKPGIGVALDDFTDEDRARYDTLSQIINDPAVPGKRKRSALRERNKIISRYRNSGRNKTIKDLINQLGSLTQKTPTSYYWDRMTTFIPYMAEYGKYLVSLDPSKDEIVEINTFVTDFIQTVDAEDWDRLDFILFESANFGEFLDWLKVNKESQYNWFRENHSEKAVFDQQNGSYTKLKYVRSVIYNHSEPVREEHKKIEYNKRFRRKRVKDEYRTGYNPETKKVELVVGRHITNREYNGFPEFMPLLPEDGEPADSPYRNEAFYKLRDSNDSRDKLRWEYLQAVRTADLLEQEKVPARLRRWNQVPVMGLSEIEELANPKQVLHHKLQDIKSAFKKDTEVAGEDADAEAEASGEDTTKQIDQFTQTTITDRIPKLGMASKIPVDRVSRDLLKSVSQMIIRAHEFEGRTEAEPVVKALLRVMQNPEFKSDNNKERAKKFEAIYSQMILQEIPGGTVNSKAVRRFARFITANTSLRMLADPIGGIINYGSAMINNIIEASAGKYLNLNDLAKGKYLAFRINAGLMADYNKKSNLSYETLLFDTFDMIQGEFEEDLLDRSSSQDKHASIRQLLMIPRKAGELMAQTAVAMGILDRNKVKNTIDGKEYSVHEIYEKHGNNLRLKQGFPEEWNPIDGRKFVKMKELINRVNLELHGNYAKISQTEASRYALGKLAENMKRWFMPAFQRRFGRETLDTTLETLNEGYYRTCGRAAQKFFGSLFKLDFGGMKSWMSMFMNTPRYRQNMQRMGAEAAQAFLLFITFSLMLGYMGDDKNKKLKENSWIHNTAILVALRMYSETTAYIPIPALGFQEMKRNALAPFSLPADAISNFAALGQLGMYQVLYWMGADGLEDDLYYSKDSGYWYTEKGDSKLLKYLLRTAGYTGYTTEPATYIQQFDNLQKRMK